MTYAKDTMPRQYQLRPAHLSDLPSIAQVWTSAFFDDEIIGHIMHPHRDQYPGDVYWFLLRGIRERFWDWRHRFIVVTSNEGTGERVVGAADWRRLGKGGDKMKPMLLHPVNLISPLLKSYHALSLYSSPTAPPSLPNPRSSTPPSQIQKSTGQASAESVGICMFVVWTRNFTDRAWGRCWRLGG
jgi:hypothetical protein